MLQACNDIPVPDNTDSAPVALLLLGVAQGREHKTGSELSADARQPPAAPPSICST